MALHFPVAPMKATMGSLPPELEDDRWAYEIKWDGYRALAFVHDGTVRLQSSSGRDMTAQYPELASLADGLNGTSAILDGEVVVVGADGRPSFEALQRHQTPVVFQAFDVLQVNGTDAISLPYEQRRALLAQVLEPGPGWAVPAHRIGDGAALLAATAAQDLEGVMAKRLGSPYQPGKRSPNWRKVKNRVPTEVVIGGYSAGKGNRSGTFGALLVGTPRPDGSLAFAGGVGTGFDQARLESLTSALRSRTTTTCPFTPPPPRLVAKDATWVRPDLRATIEIAEFTNDGLVRHASFVTLIGPDTRA